MEVDAGVFEALMASFNARIKDLQEALLLRTIPAGSRHAAELASIDAVVRGMEQQLQAIKSHLSTEHQAFPKAKSLIDLSLQQQEKLNFMLMNLPPHLPGSNHISQQSGNSVEGESSMIQGRDASKCTETVIHKEKKIKSPPRWYVTVEELDALSSYMRGRLTLDKINGAVDEMALFAEANSRLLAAPRKKLSEESLERALELRDIALAEPIKGKFFFLESDMRGPILKLDNTGKAILTLLRHVGRIVEVRVGRQRALVLVKP